MVNVSGGHLAFEDILWDEVHVNDDHIVPQPSHNQVNGIYFEDDSQKKLHFQYASIQYKAGDKRRDISVMSNKRDTVSEEDIWSHAAYDGFPSDSCTTNEAPSLKSDYTKNHDLKDNLISSYMCATVDANSFLFDNIPQAENNVNSIVNNRGEQGSSDFTCYDWSEIGDFEDVNRMLSHGDELGWISSVDSICDPGDMMKSSYNFVVLDPYGNKNISENHNSLDPNERFPINCSALGREPDYWPLEGHESASHVSIANGYTSSNGKDSFMPKTKINKLSNEVSSLLSHQACLSMGNQQEHQPLQSYSDGYVSNHFAYEESEILSCLESDNNDNNELTSLSQNVYSYASNNVQSMESFLDPSSQAPPIADDVKMQKQYLHQDSQLSISRDTRNETGRVGSSMLYPGLEKQLHISADQLDDDSGKEVLSMVIPEQLGSLEVQEESSLSSGLNDSSQEAASFQQLQYVMGKLDLSTKLCIRDSLYRLAQSAEQRHLAEQTSSCRDDRYRHETFTAEGTNQSTGFLNVEAGTNPIDRSIAHLLFHRPGP